MKMVQVISEAKARPIITALTSTSADLNIDHGDNSRSSATAVLDNLPSRSAGAAVVSEVGDTVAPTARRAGAIAGAGTAGTGCAATAEGPCGTGRCWAAAAETTAVIVNAVSNLRTILNIAALHPWPNRRSVSGSAGQVDRFKVISPKNSCQNREIEPSVRLCSPELAVTRSGTGKKA